MIDAPLAFSFSAGLVATINPCGFAMLPAYLSYFMGVEDESEDRDTAASIARALGVGLVVSAGFLLVFSVVGVLVTAGIRSVDEWMPWASIVVGVGLAGLGVAMLAGYHPVVNLPRLERGTSGRGVRSLFLFGVSYAIASLSCALPVFLVVVSGTATRENFVSGMAAFAAYALGMSLVLLVLTMALALAKRGVVHRLRGAMRHVDRVSGALLVVAGAYLVYYWAYELAADDDATAGRGPIDTVYDWSADAANWVDDVGGVRLGLMLATILTAALLYVLSRPRRT